jgi:archaellin
MKKKGMSGITTIIIMITGILIVVIAALYILEIGFTMEQKAYMTSDNAKKHLSNKIYIDEIGSSYDSSGNLREFYIICQLLPTSDLLRFNNIDLIMQTKNDSAVISYRKNGSTVEGNTGYNTWGYEHIGLVNRTTNYTLNLDYDDDGHDDYLFIDSSGTLHFNFSSADQYTVPMGQIDCSGATHLEYFEENINIDEIKSIYIKGMCGNLEVPANVSFTIVPGKYGRGYYTIEYLKTNSLFHSDGRLVPGEIVKIYFETLIPIGLDQAVTLILQPTDGNPTEKRFQTPSTQGIGNVFFD